MIWNIVSDSSCDLQMNQFSSEMVRFETVPLRIQVGEREFVDNEQTNVADMVEYFKAYKGKSSTACPSVRICSAQVSNASYSGALMG